MSETRLLNDFAISGRSAGRSAGLSVFDLILAVVLVIFFAPLMLVVATLVYLQDGGPVFFAHRRLGYGGETFPCLKFRSMAVDAEARLERLLEQSAEARAEWAQDHKLKNDPRITPLGAFLRRSSLDELPQLFNVLRGEMRFVGPRPIVQAEVARYGRHFSAYCSVQPGITGLWQVSGRSNLSYRRRVAIDSLYARRRGPGLDLKILFMTLPAVLLKRGSY